MRCAESSRCRAAGFSLIELMVALVVFALTVLALLNLAGENTRAAVLIEESVLAGVVADNQAVKAMLDTPGASEGVELAGERQWRWTRTLSATDVPGIMRIEVKVLDPEGDRVAASLSLLRSER